MDGLISEFDDPSSFRLRNVMRALMTSEGKIGLAVMQIASGQPNKIATFTRCRAEMHKVVKLSAAEVAISGPRHPEPMWHQIVRNIKSHHGIEGNFIDRNWLKHISRVGYQITPAGEAHLKKIAVP